MIHRNAQIEERVLKILDRVVAGQPVEDDFVELKTRWPDAKKTARQLAGHANAARGASILWIIGADEKGHRVPGADPEELADWWARVCSQFEDGIHPELATLSVPYTGSTVIALHLETDRAPFVVTNGRGGPPDLEVPWREGNSTRTATRSDLLRVLVPAFSKPEFEVLDGELRLYEDIRGKVGFYAVIGFDLYVTTSDQFVIPYHRCGVRIVAPDLPPVLGSPEVRLKTRDRHPGGLAMVSVRGGIPTENDSKTIATTFTEAIVAGPGFMSLEATVSLDGRPTSPPEEMEIHLRLGTTQPSEIRLLCKMRRTEHTPGQPQIAEFSFAGTQ